MPVTAWRAPGDNSSLHLTSANGKATTNMLAAIRATRELEKDPVSAERPWEDFQDPLTASAPPTAAPTEAAPWEAYTDPIAGPDKPPPQFNQPFGELKPYTPSPSERIGQWASDLFRGAGADPYTAGKFGRGARDVLGLTPAGPLMAGADVQHYAGEGEYGKAALSAVGVLPGTSLARERGG